MAKKKTRHPEDEISFEHAFEELQQIVARLEEGQLTLGDSLKCYEQGILRLKECYRALDEAENRIRILTSIDDDGNLEMSDFDAEDKQGRKASAAGATGKRRPRRKKPVDDEGLF